MLKNFSVYTIVPIVDNNLLVGTSYGPLFLDETDFAMFGFEPTWLINNIDTQVAHELLSNIKMYYMEQAAQLKLNEEE